MLLFCSSQPHRPGGGDAAGFGDDPSVAGLLEAIGAAHAASGGFALGGGARHGWERGLRSAADPAPDIASLARVAMEALDALLPGRFDLYGSHTGASIGMEIAIAHPDRVRRLVIDGMGLYAADEQSEILDRYAREIEPDLEGTHLLKVWHFCRDQYLFWPYYNRTAAGRLPNGLPDAESFHDFVVEVLKAMRSYHRSYRAAFRHPKRERLPELRQPVLVACSPSDMLRHSADAVADLVPGARRADLPRWEDAAFEAGCAATIEAFLDEDG